MSTPSIETIDKLPQPQPHDRVNPSGKASEERDQEAFKKMLRRRLERGEHEDGETDESEALIVEIDMSNDNEQPAEEDRQAADRTDEQKAEDETADAGDKDASPAPPAHIDLRA